MILTLLIAAFAACGLFLVFWALYESCFAAFPADACHVIPLSGDAAAVSSRAKRCLWQQRQHGLRGTLLFVDCGIEPEAQIALQLLLRGQTAQVCSTAQAAEFLETEKYKVGAGAD